MKSIIHTDRVIIRELTLENKNEFISLYQDEKVSKYLTKQTVQADEEKFNTALLGYKTRTPLGRWGIFDPANDKFMGVATLKPADADASRIELGYVLHYDFWGRGLAKEIALALADYGFNQLGLNEICAVTDPENKISQHVLTKIGFTREGSVFWYGQHVPFFIKRNS